MNQEEFGETAHNYSDAHWLVVNLPTSVRRTVVFVPSLATSNVKVKKDHFFVENFAQKTSFRNHFTP